MNSTTLRRTLALGAITGMRSMAGPAALAFRPGGLLSRATMMLAAGEMVADKTPYVGARTAPLPFAGRVLSGALVGGVIAREERANMVMGALIGAAAAAIAAHLAYHARKRLPLSNVVGGSLEDLVVVGIGALAADAGSRT